MRQKTAYNVAVFVLLAALAALALLLLGGCVRPAGPELEGLQPAGSKPTTPAAAVSSLAVWLAAAGGLAFIAAVVYGWLSGNLLRAAQYVGAAVCVIVGAGILGFIGAHLAAITWTLVGLGVVVGGVALYRHRKTVEKHVGIDLDKDGRVG